MIHSLGWTATVRMIRESRGMTQQQLADAAGVSLSTVRRLEREVDARFHSTTERQIEFALKLKDGALEHLRTGGSVDAAFEDRFFIRFGRSDHYREAPLSDIVVPDSYVAKVMAKGLAAVGARATEELSLLAAGRLFPDHGRGHHDFLFDWLPWPARLTASAVWLHRAHDSADQVRSVLENGLVPRPLRMAEAVMIKIAYHRAWVIDTNAFFHEGEEVDDPLNDSWELVYDHCDPRPLFDADRFESECVDVASPLHPHRWWAAS